MKGRLPTTPAEGLVTVHQANCSRAEDDFYIRYRYILKGQRLLTLGSKAEHLLEQIPETGHYVFLNPKTGAPYQLHEFYYLHKRILKQAGLPWVAFRDLQSQCRKVGL